MAREAGARHLVPFHFSPRYLDRPEALRAEVEQAFAGDSRKSLRAT
jgi:ribonuclease Z